MAATFLYGQLFAKLPYPTDLRTGETVIITGSNVGLGKEAARHFARLGAGKVILAVRNIDKGVQAKEDIEASTECSKDTVEVWQVDMASYASVQTFAARAEAELERIDVFLANAGIAPAKYAVLEENEASITINVVSTLLLTALILPKMKDTAAKFGVRPSLTITSSGVHGHTTVPQKSAPKGNLLKAINDQHTAEQHWNDQYPISKLLEVLAVRSIAEKYGSSGYPVTINAADPGLCHSELGRDFPSFGFWLVKAILARSTEAGSRTLLHAASAGPGSHGQYLSDCKITAPAAFVTSVEGREVQERAWEELVDKLEIISPGVTNNF